MAEKGQIFAGNVAGGFENTQRTLNSLSEGLTKTVPDRLAYIGDSFSGVGTGLSSYLGKYQKLADDLSVTAPPRINAFIEGIPGYFNSKVDDLAELSSSTQRFFVFAQLQFPHYHCDLFLR